MSNSIMAWRHIDGTRHADRAIAKTTENKAAFLTELAAQGGDAKKARAKLGLTRNRVNNWRNRDTAFLVQMDAAMGIETKHVQEQMPAYIAEERERRKAEFLSAVRQTRHVKDACRVSGIRETTVGSWRRDDPVFAKALAAARQTDAEVLARLVRGGSDKSIAAELGVDRSTISRRVARIMRKFGFANREQLAQTVEVQR